jgi:hypothetical protein
MTPPPLPPLQLEELAETLALRFCALPYVNGIQLDLEPFAEPYVTVCVFMQRTPFVCFTSLCVEPK